jgi:hypothetical protein
MNSSATRLITALLMYAVSVGFACSGGDERSESLPPRFGIDDCFLDQGIDGIFDLQPAECGKFGVFQVVFLFQVEGDTYPGRPLFKAAADEKCPRSTASDARQGLGEISNFFYPSEADWERGDRTVICAEQQI